MPNLRTINWNVLILLVMLGNTVECRQQKCQVSEDLLFRLCYYKSRDKLHFIHCQETFCESNPDGSPSDQKIIRYNESQCLQQLCQFSPGEGDIQQCINKLNNYNFFLSNLPLIIFLTSIPIGLITGIVSHFLPFNCFKESESSNLTSINRQKNLSKRDQQISHNYFREKQKDFIYPLQQHSSTLKADSQMQLSEQTLDVQQQKKLQLFNLLEPQPYPNLQFVSSEFKNKTFCICLSSQKLNCQTSCLHFYHLNCLLEWTQIKKFCPCCKENNFIPLKIFCCSCGKIKSQLKLEDKHHLDKNSKVSQLADIFLNCKQCRTKYLTTFTENSQKH